MITVIHPGALTTVQDRGRPGRAEIGVPESGALDHPSMQLANRLVGNPEGSAVLEGTLGGPTLRFERAATIAVTGPEAVVTVAGRMVAMNTPCRVERGQELAVGYCTGGAHPYVAVRGGIAVPPVLGSRSTDVLTGLGPAPLAGGIQLPVGEPELPQPAVDAVPVAPLAPEPELRVVLGPRADWFTDQAIESLLTRPFRVGSAVNRVGARLEGAPLARREPGELLSEGIVAGAIQVPPSGSPILLLSDHPTTGGYPVIATVATADRPAAGQLRPGQTLRFRAIDPPLGNTKEMERP